MSGELPTMYWRWNGDAMMPLNPERARKGFVVGENYRLEIREERSPESQGHYFAVLKEAWDNLPEAYATKFPTPEHLRKWCLIKTGYREERTFPCETNEEALKIAAFVKPLDDYAVVVVRGNIVIVATAKSQSVKAMGKAEFQKSKDAVLGELAKLVGTAPATLRKNAARAA